MPKVENMARQSHMRHAWRALLRRHGQTIGVCVIVLLVLALMGLLIWYMSDVRFRAR